MANIGGCRGLVVASLLALAACADPERDPPQVYAEPSLVDLALATAGATRAQMGGLDHLQALCARESCMVRPLTHAEAAAGCDGAADRQRCVFVHALEAYALQLFPSERAGQLLAEHLLWAPGEPHFSSYEACIGDDPIICEVVHEDCAIVPAILPSFDTVTRKLVVDLALRPDASDFLIYANVHIWDDRSTGRARYLECVAKAAGER